MSVQKNSGRIGMKAGNELKTQFKSESVSFLLHLYICKGNYMLFFFCLLFFIIALENPDKQKGRKILSNVIHG